MIGTYADTFAAVNTAHVHDLCLAFLHADGIRGAPLDAVCAAAALFPVQTDGMKISFHDFSLHAIKKTISIRVPDGSDLIFRSSTFLLMLGSPMPAPKPIMRILSGAVE